jgi:hypothetical protein
MMAAHTGLTQTAVSWIWRAFQLKPHVVDYWKPSTDPHFVDKLYDVVVGIDLDPPERAWCCVWTRNPRCRPWTGPRRPLLTTS